MLQYFFEESQKYITFCNDKTNIINMADIIKHQTSIQDLYMYIDSVDAGLDSIYRFNGWICSTVNEVEDILIVGKSISMNLIEALTVPPSGNSPIATV